MMKKIFFICGILMVSVLSRAEQISIPWTCGFEAEDTVEMSQWILNPGTSDATDQWTIGNACSSEDMQSLYISTDGGTTASFGSTPDIVMAYRLINLPVQAKEYYVSFDYRQPSNEGTLYVFFDYASTLISGTDGWQVLQYANSSRADGIPTKVLTTARYVTTQFPSTAASRTQEMRNTSEWHNVTIDCGEGTYYSDRFTNNTSKRQLALVFVWINKNSVETEGVGACIDNITIVDSHACGKPQALTISTQGKDSLVLNWQGDAQEYEVGCYSHEKDTWQVARVSTNQYVFTDVPEGFTDFYVRTICWDSIKGEEYFIAKVQSSEFIYYPGNHCIDYLTLTDDNCYISSVKTQYVTEDYKYIHQMVDYGPESKESRHTHHYSKTETDVFTGGRLHKVPEGEIASVRLGNWNKGGESERVEFDFHVDATQNPILVMKYAVVLESPGHDSGKKSTSKELQDPRFTFDVLHNGRSIGSCTSVDYNASWVHAGWNDTTINYMDGRMRQADIVWKDWTTVGFNLADYDGENLTIRLTTFDCSLSAHFGYAYFTLGCSDGKFKINDNNSFEAPDGFDYRWMNVSSEQYRNEDGSIPEQYVLSRNQTFAVDSLDENIYVVDCMYKSDSTCFYSLHTVESEPEDPCSHTPATIYNLHDTIYDDETYYHRDAIIWQPGMSKPNSYLEVVYKNHTGECDSLIYRYYLTILERQTSTPVGIPVTYTKDGTILDSEQVTFHLPIPPTFEGFTFVKWIAVSDDVIEGIEIQAIYTADVPSFAPEVVTNPANPTQKLIRDGNVFILRGDKTYTITGQKVR